MKVKSLSRVRLLATPWTAAYQAPLPMGFTRQEYWSGVPCLLRSALKYISKYYISEISYIKTIILIPGKLIAFQIYLPCKFTKTSAHTHIYELVCQFLHSIFKIFDKMLSQNCICTRTNPRYTIPRQSH